MKVVRSREFKTDRPWGSLPIARMQGITTSLHWTDTPYVWHVNAGEEVFVVLDGAVEMHYREDAIEHCVRLDTGDIFFAGTGCEHVAYPLGEARVLVVEHEGTI